MPQPLDASLHRLDQDEAHVRLDDRERDAGEAGAAADVRHRSEPDQRSDQSRVHHVPRPQPRVLQRPEQSELLAPRGEVGGVAAGELDPVAEDDRGRFGLRLDVTNVSRETSGGSRWSRWLSSDAKRRVSKPHKVLLRVKAFLESRGQLVELAYDQCLAFRSRPTLHLLPPCGARGDGCCRRTRCRRRSEGCRGTSPDHAAASAKRTSKASRAVDTSHTSHAGEVSIRGAFGVATQPPVRGAFGVATQPPVRGAFGVATQPR